MRIFTSITNKFMNEFNKNTGYRSPSTLKANWNYVGDGKFHDPSQGRPEMHGRRWMIDPSYYSGKSFSKLQQALKEYEAR